MSTALTQAKQNLKKGHYVVLIDDLEESISGFLCAAAQHCTPEIVNTMVTVSRGVITAPISEGRLRELYLHPSQRQTQELAIAVEARHNVSTGISAADRAQTLKTLANTTRPKTELVIPGHIFPRLSKEGGVLVRASAYEAATDLLVLAGLKPVAALSRCLDEQGQTIDSDQLEILASKHSISTIGISEILCERLANESLIEKITNAHLPLDGMENFSATAFRSKIDGAEHLALILGDINSSTPPLVRVQSESRISDLFGLGQQSSRDTMARALGKINQEGSGVFIYIRHPRRGVVAKQVKALGSESLKNSSRAGQLREYGIGTQILNALKIKSLRLLTTKARPIYGIENFQIKISSQVEF